MHEESKLEQSQTWEPQFDSREGRGIDLGGIDYSLFEKAGEDEDVVEEREEPTTFCFPSEADIDGALTTFCSPLTDDDPFEEEEDIVQIFCKEAASGIGPKCEQLKDPVALIYECEVDERHSGVPKRFYTSELTAGEVHTHLAKKVSTFYNPFPRQF